MPWNSNAGQTPIISQENALLQCILLWNNRCLSSIVILWQLNVGIPDSVNNNESVFQEIWCELSPRDLEACHRLKKNCDRIIVKFSRRKDYEQIMSVQNDLKKVEMQDIGLVNIMLWWKCKKLLQTFTFLVVQ